VDNMDGFFQGRWHGVSIPQFRSPKCEQLPKTASLRVLDMGSTLVHPYALS
jgi:hypothetical protein